MRRRRPNEVFHTRCFSNLANPDLKRGDWLIIGVLAIRRAVSIEQFPVCVNAITGERRICRDWGATLALGSPAT
jgi:hypothetical protein